jgi:lysophospholipase L1-like esterase
MTPIARIAAALLVAAPVFAAPPPLGSAAPPSAGAHAAARQVARPDTPPAGAPDASPVALRDEETIVFYGDSITEQNLYTAYLETFFLSRFPARKIACFNFGWGGDTAIGGNARFARDVAPVQPSLVFVNFGMNDGGYKAYEETIYRGYIDAQKALADTIAATRAREVLLTTSPVDDVLRGDNGVYNETLSRMAAGVVDLARERDLPAIDIFHPMLEVQRRAKAKDPGFTMIPDTVHPDPVGHLVMAYAAIRQIDAPRVVAEMVVDGDAVEASGATVTHVTGGDGGVTFDLDLPFLPFYVPSEARKALELVPFEEELNRFQLRARVTEPLVLSVDGKTAGTFPPEALAQGVDLALLDDAPWAKAGQLLWRAAQYRWTKHLEAWRRMGIDRPAYMLPALASFEPLVRSQRAYADELGRSLGTLARPRTYHVSLLPPGLLVPIAAVELSPAYPLEAFDTEYPPEKDPAGVAWTRAPFVNGQIDLGRHFDRSTQVVAYARVLLEANRACTLHLAMGSDDGLAVFANGRRVFAHDVLRSLRPGEDEAEVPLAGGRNELLFKVTQAGGDFALAVEARVRGRARVRVAGRDDESPNR